MTQTIITAGDSSAPLAVQGGDDGTLVLKTGAAGSKVNAVVYAADGTPTFLKAIVIPSIAGISGLTVTQSNQTPLPTTLGTTLSYTHGLGATPTAAELELVCLTAELGYAVGDTVTGVSTSPGSGVIIPFSIKKNSTTVTSVVGANAAWYIVHGTSGVTANPTAANWAWRFKVRTA
jgi:hypothetical protein